MAIINVSLTDLISAWVDKFNSLSAHAGDPALLADSDLVTAINNISLNTTFGELTVTGNVDINGNLTLGDSAGNTLTFPGTFTGNLIPTADDTYDVGSASLRWKDAYIDGVAYIDAFVYNGVPIATTAAEINLIEGLTDSAQVQLDAKVARTSSTGSAQIPTGTEAQRDGSPTAGYFRFNTTTGQFEGYNGTAWGSVGGGATGANGDEVFIENDQTVTSNYTITAGRSAMSTGPITVDSGVTVTIPDGSRYVIL